MSKKATVIWRYILGALIIVLSVVMIIGLTSCESVDTDDYQETITDESEIKSDSESKSEIKSDSETKPQQETGTKPESEKETIQTQKTEGIISWFSSVQNNGITYCYFELEGIEGRYYVSINNTDKLQFEVGSKVIVEYVDLEDQKVHTVQKIILNH